MRTVLLFEINIKNDQVAYAAQICTLAYHAPFLVTKEGN